MSFIGNANNSYISMILTKMKYYNILQYEILFLCNNNNFPYYSSLNFTILFFPFQYYCRNCFYFAKIYYNCVPDFT